MEKSLSRYLIVTDIDDTLLPHEGEIPKRNLDAIYRFQKKGGKFTFAVGLITIVQNYTVRSASTFLRPRITAPIFMIVQPGL